MQDFLPWITGSGGALVVLAIGAYLFLAGKLHSDGEFRRVLDERDHLRDALETERATSNELARSGGVAAKALDALVEVATGRHDSHPPLPPAPLDLTARELGL